MPGMLAAWGRHLFGPRDELEEIDGTHVGGFTIRVGPNGSLVAVQDPKRKEATDD